LKGIAVRRIAEAHAAGCPDGDAFEFDGVEHEVVANSPGEFGGSSRKRACQRKGVEIVETACRSLTFCHSYRQIALLGADADAVCLILLRQNLIAWLRALSLEAGSAGRDCRGARRNRT